MHRLSGWLEEAAAEVVAEVAAAEAALVVAVALDVEGAEERFEDVK